MKPDCVLCQSSPGEQIAAESKKWRIIHVDDFLYPGFFRVIWHSHVAEMTELSLPDRQELMTVVFAVERALRDVMHPDKVNLASLGNMVPHLHWHVIPRFRDDAHFPESVWGTKQREPAPIVLKKRRSQQPEVAEAISRILAQQAKAL
ncbi:HIT family protein [Oxalobacter vibrioformis]|uniref:HIT family protein n=1 Tax=Oxalobacter vibrioformis TaxID=933080 RepID=A0A9E9LXP6_9BURK|nr:HIT family protein [Oxalobacter vibrioformis]WAW09138.1 HIT family protein [Oxalobacter vibrioformis]